VKDFGACRTDVIALGLFYPVIGVLLTWIAFDRNLVPLLFPVISGFALIGAVAGVGLYEMSRMREKGEEPSWGMPSPSSSIRPSPRPQRSACCSEASSWYGC
jgi:uncharacterized membrane protein